MIFLEQAAKMMLRHRRKEPPGPVIYHPLTSALDTLPTGQAVTITGTAYEATSYQGIACMKFDASTEANVAFRVPYTTRGRREAWSGTVSIWMARYGLNTSTNNDFLTIGTNFASTAGSFAIAKRTNTGIFAGVRRSKATNGVRVITLDDSNFHHICMMCSVAGNSSTAQGAANVYIDGTYADAYANILGENAWSYAELGYYQGSGNTQNGGIYVAALRVWDRLLDEAEISALAAEFAPTP